MSEAVSALNGAEFKGQVTIRDNGPRGMISLRANLDSVNLRNAATGVTGLDFPEERGARCVGENGLCWMSPDEFLVLLPYAKVGNAVQTIWKTLASEHHLAVDVSDARSSFTITGEGAAIREVLAKLTPANLHPTALPVGEIRRTRLAQVSAAIWFHEETRLELICFRSVSDYVFELLSVAATPGREVGYF